MVAERIPNPWDGVRFAGILPLRCPFSTMVVPSIGIGAAQVRFLKRAPAVVKVPASAVRVATAIRGHFSRREAGLPSRASRVRISVPALSHERRHVSAGGSGGRFTKPAGEGSTPSRDATALARGSRVALPKRDYAVRFGTRAPQGSGNGVPVGLITRCQKRTRFDSEPCNHRDEPRWHRRFIRARARDRVSPSRPIRSRLTR